MRSIKLFCLPYAGGSSIIYRNWGQRLSQHIEVIAIELAGRGKRSGEPLYTSLEDALQDIHQQMVPHLTSGDDYALFGHSMGAMLAYETAQSMRRYNLPAPVHAFFSGRGVPHVKVEKEKSFTDMDDEEFLEAVLALGGTPKEFFDHPELLDYLLPILRSDFKLSESDPPHTEVKPLDCPITIMVGKGEDELEPRHIDGWKHHTTQLCTVCYFNGGHFFINDETGGIASVIDYQLNSSKAKQKMSFIG